MSFNKQVTSTATMATIATITALVTAYLYYRRRKNRVPEKWTPVGRVKELLMYPLKSGRRKQLQSAECTKLGIRLHENDVELRDRCFLVYGADNHELKTARTFPKLILIETVVKNSGECVFTAPGQDPLTVTIPDCKKKRIKLTLIQKEPSEGHDCGDEAAAWLSNYILEKPSGVRLAYHDGVYRRNIERHVPQFAKAFHRFRNDCAGAYQDLTSYHLVTQSSVDALNKHLSEPVTAHNFRPNILIEGKDLLPYTEEDWNWIKIGDAVFYNAKSCTRCVMTTVDYDVGALSKKREPLTTLEKTNNLKDPAHIAAEGKKGVMGIHLGIKKLGNIKVGDQVYIG